MASLTQDHRVSLSLSIPTQTSRSHESRHHRFVVDPTPENQRIYNEIRQTLERMHFQTHVASQQNRLSPQAAPSISTIHSPTEDPGTPSTQDPPPQETDRPRRPRGRRKGPLDSNTRLNTALKRKLKLTCPHHRLKKTTCDCHDFSRLEEGYQNALQSSNHGRPHDRNDVMSLTPIDRTWNTFGAVGAAIVPPEQDPVSNDLGIDLHSSIGNQDVVRSNVQQIVSGFDADSVHLDRDMLQGPGQTYHPGNDIDTQSPGVHIQGEFLEIGSQNESFPNRWHCEFKGLTDTASDTSSEPCSWSGPFRELSYHFRTKHYYFHDIKPSFWFVCTRCRTRAEAPENPESPLPPFRCNRQSCAGSPCQRWYFGSTRDESVGGSALALTQYSESEAGYSWKLHPEGNQSWPGGGASNSPYLGGSNPYERSYFHNAKWNMSSDSSGLLSGSARYPHEAIRPVRKDCARSHRQCPIRLMSCAKLSIGHLLSIVVPLLTTIVRESEYFSKSDPSPSCSIDTDAISWLSLVLLLIGFMATWTLKDRAEARITDDKSSSRARGRQRPRNRFPATEIPLYRFGTLMAT